jgi:hypothetical protein
MTRGPSIISEILSSISSQPTTARSCDKNVTVKQKHDVVVLHPCNWEITVVHEGFCDAGSMFFKPLQPLTQ